MAKEILIPYFDPETWHIAVFRWVILDGQEEVRYDSAGDIISDGYMKNIMSDKALPPPPDTRGIMFSPDGTKIY